MPNLDVSLPRGWKKTQLRRLVDIRNGRDYKAVEVPEGGYPVYGSGGEFRRSSDFLYDGESILFGRKGTIDRPLYVDGKFWTVDTMYYAVPFENVWARFLYYYATTIPFTYYVTSTALPSVTQEDLAGHPILLPPLDEQRAVADYLDRETQKIDELITEQRSLIEILRERRIALISRAVRLGLNLQVEHQVTGVDWLGDIPSHWEVKRLKYSVESVLPGVWGSEPIGDESDVRCVRVADFDRPHLRVGDDIPTMRSVAPNDRQSRALRAGDLLIEKSGGTAINPVGFVAIYEGGDESTVYANFIARMRPSVGQVSRYWLYAHAASYATRLTFRSVKQTTGIQNLDQSAYFDELFPFPPPEEQREIVNYLDDQTSRIDELIAESEDLIGLSQERRAALITAAVTGQIDVRRPS